MFHHEFRTIPDATARMQTKQFAFVPSISFLCLLPSQSGVKQLPTGNIELSAENAELFAKLQRGQTNFTEAMKLFRKRSKGDELGDKEEG